MAEPASVTEYVRQWKKLCESLEAVLRDTEALLRIVDGRMRWIDAAETPSPEQMQELFVLREESYGLEQLQETLADALEVLSGRKGDPSEPAATEQDAMPEGAESVEATRSTPEVDDGRA